jgi:hypothetical protein
MSANKWKCPNPKCGASNDEHGKEPSDICRGGQARCMGLICECDRDTAPKHGETFEDPCEHACCYHCGWGGTLPQPPKKLASWEKKALAAGWTPPASRF